MTGSEWEIAVKLIVIFIQLLKLCGAIHNIEGSFFYNSPYNLNGYIFNNWHFIY